MTTIRPTKTRAEWVTEIRRLGRKSAESLIALGRALTEAKADLGHGQFGAMLRHDLKLHPRAAQRLMKLAHNPRFAKATNLSHLPAAVSALEILATAPEEVIEHGIESGLIHPATTAREIQIITAPLQTEPAEKRVYVSYTAQTKPAKHVYVSTSRTEPTASYTPRISYVDAAVQSRLQSIMHAVSVLSRESELEVTAIAKAAAAMHAADLQTFKRQIGIAMDSLMALSVALGEQHH